MTNAIQQEITANGGGAWATIPGAGFRVHVDLDDGDEIAFGESVALTLAEPPRWLHCRWLYDELGSKAYERITEQPEYYLTRVEDRILSDNAAALRSIVGDSAIVELGSGSSTKTRHILDAWLAAGEAHYVPIDISLSALEQACAEVAAAYPGLQVDGLAARYRRGLPMIRGVSPLLLLFLGSTIGNFNDDEMDDFLRSIADALRPGDHFLFGLDLVKEPEVLLAAYNDTAGWTERFILNIVARMNRELGTEIPMDAVAYEGIYNDAAQRIEMYLRFDRDVDVRLGGGESPIAIGRGESVMVEISRKFTVETMVAKLERFGFALERKFLDPDEFFAVLLLTRRGQ